MRLSITTKKTTSIRLTKAIDRNIHPEKIFNKCPVVQSSSQKHLDKNLDYKLDFVDHFQSVMNKINKTIGLLRKLRQSLPRSALITIYKSFIRPRLDYGDIVYDQAYNESV